MRRVNPTRLIASWMLCIQLFFIVKCQRKPRLRWNENYFDRNSKEIVNAVNFILRKSYRNILSCFTLRTMFHKTLSSLILRKVFRKMFSGFNFMKVIPQSVMSLFFWKLFHKILLSLILRKLFVVLLFSASNLGFSRNIFRRSTAVSYVPNLLCFLFPRLI